jgi:glycosyltransferase involved in cell wall biosynthesis
LDYILVTPILNEVDHLIQLKETILNQTVRPRIWVIGDGNSTDHSYEVATEIFKNYPWIHVIKQKTFSEEGYSHKNFSNNVNDCMTYARNVCINQNIEYSYVGKTDATPLLSPDYFETLMREMEKNPKVALTCGLQYLRREKNPDDDIHNTRSYEVVKSFNDIRLYDRRFIEQAGNYPVFFFPDSILRIKALKTGWETKKVNATYFVKLRVGGSKIGYWKGYKLKGNGMYAIGYHPVLLMLNALVLTKSYPFYIGLAMAYGYLSALLRNEEKIKDPDVLEYFWKDRLAQVARGILIEGGV